MHIFGKGFNFEIMMKQNNNRIIISNEACKFFDPANFYFQSFISLLLTNKFRNERAEILFQFNKNQHLEKMLVFFCSINRMAPIILQERVFGGNKIAHAHIVALIKNYLSKSIISI